MSSFQNQDNFTDKLASLNLNSTEESVLKEYRKNDEYYKAALLSEIISVATKNIISSGEIDDFKKYLQFIIGILNYEKEENPKKFNETIKDAIKNTNFIILACKYNKIDILTFMMDEKNQTYSSCCQPGNYDKENHNAFYYTIRDDRKDFIEVLLDEWPGYVNSEEVYRALADAYAEADLQMLTLSDELIMFIAERSIDHYFYSDDQEDKNIIVSLPDIKARDEYSNSNDLNSILSLRSKFITYNINILKQQMKATYSKIFWEEIEFYLLAFVTSRENSKVENMNLLKFLMPKSKLLHYLDLFASILENEMKNIDDQNLDTLKNYPRESRVKMVPKILKSNPKVREFYEDYQRVKDACALNLISHSVDISLNSYSDEKDKPVFLDTKRGQMAVKRTLQIIAEMMKNNWESPNMTRSLSLLLLTTLSSRTRQIVVNFHNSSFIHTQTRKLGKGNSNDPNEETIFKNIQADLKLIEWMTRSILHVTLIHYLTVMLETIVKIKTPEDLRSYINSLDLDFVTEWYAEYEVDLNWNYDTLISEFNNLISRIKTDVDDSLESLEFLVDKTDIRGINAKDRFEHVDYLIHFKRMCSSVNKANFNSYFFQKIKTEANFALDEKLDEKEWKIGSNSTSYHILNYMFAAAPRLISNKAIVLNAKKLCLRSDEINEKKIGKIFQTNIKELEEKHSRHLSCLINQNEMFQAIEQGDIKRLECAINTGADINGSDCHRWSSLHFAAKGESSLHIAAKYGQIEIVKWFMRDVKNPGVLDNSKVTSLHFAVRFNQIEIVKILLQSKTELSFKELIHLAVLNNSKDVVEFLVHCCLSNENQTPLHIAAKNGYAELTQYLISLQPDVNCRSDGEVTPLLDAAVYGHVETVKILLSNNADVNIGSNKGTTALHVAAQYGHEEVVKVLLENVFNGYPEIVQLLLEKKALDIPYEESGNSAVHLAAMNGNIEVMRLLFRQKGQLKKRNVFHENPLYLAARYGHLEVVKFLVERGATCNNSNECRNYNPLHACAYANHPEVAKFFISQKVDLDARTKEFSTPISIAAFGGSYEIVKLLVEAGCNFNVKNARGVTPLHSAIMRSHLKVAEYLLTQDVDVKAATTNKKLPIHVALESNLFNVVPTLINKYKNSVNYQDCLNETPLYMLCKWNHPELVQVFINNGGKIIYDSKHCMNPALSTGSKDVIDVLFKNGVNIHGVLPGGVPFLHRAVQFEQLDIVKMLVAKKVDVNAFSAVKETALMIAAYYDFSEIADFLLKNKADPRLENESNLSALDVAIMKNSLDTFHLLYESLKVEVTDKINPKFKPLHDAAFYGKAVMAKFLIEQKFDVNGLNLNGNTPLHMAASGNHPLIVDILLEHGAHYDSENSENKKPWNLAQDELTVFKLEIIDSLFTYAKEGDYNGCLDCLRRNAFVNARNVYSLTPLHYACQNGFSDIVRLLLDFNADINMTANYGTPLVYAVLFDHYKVVKILLKYGAVYNVATEFGGNSLAYLSGNFDIICLLELIDKVFDAIKKCDTSIVDEIKKIKDLDILHCMLNTRNENKQQLYLEAQNSKFPEEKLVEIYGWEAYLFAQKCN
ncbi:Similar to ANK1: Ankyrin-1 (Homo sapiens) [Cotesia congregata]|uniref:Similar to ANK1: Ankyrin-1 (Homo sapiens) n=1 Tax=Cotesia congregata TaxID=51543 RepID=A0A8J2H1Y5_COTCN|nr:Similar to ANK1: Ankyrin-1 (Homo sapiens) [Cotesia congregata]